MIASTRYAEEVASAICLLFSHHPIMADEAERMAALIFAYYGDIDMLTARADAAEAEVAKWREMHADRDHDLRHEHARANALEVEVERLQAQVENLRNGSGTRRNWKMPRPITRWAASSAGRGRKTATP